MAHVAKLQSLQAFDSTDGMIALRKRCMFLMGSERNTVNRLLQVCPYCWIHYLQLIPYMSGHGHNFICPRHNITTTMLHWIGGTSRSVSHLSIGCFSRTVLGVFLANSNLRLTNGLHLVVNPLYLLWLSLDWCLPPEECSWSRKLLWRGFSSPRKEFFCHPPQLFSVVFWVYCIWHHLFTGQRFLSKISWRRQLIQRPICHLSAVIQLVKAPCSQCVWSSVHVWNMWVMCAAVT